MDYKQVRVLSGKGGKHRIVTLAEELIPGLRQQVRQVALFLERDLLKPGFAGIWMSGALARMANAESSFPTVAQRGEK